MRWCERMASSTAPTSSFRSPPARAAKGGGWGRLHELRYGRQHVANGVAIHLTRPFTRNSENDSWLVHALETNGDNFTTWNLSAFVVCLAVS
jgi:hypothetical protein